MGIHVSDKGLACMTAGMGIEGCWGKHRDDEGWGGDRAEERWGWYSVRDGWGKDWYEVGQSKHSYEDVRDRYRDDDGAASTWTTIGDPTGIAGVTMGDATFDAGIRSSEL
jgi:hypothetical protein